MIGRIRYLSGLAGIGMPIALTSMLGHRASRFLGRTAGSLLFVLGGHVRRKVLHNIDYAYGSTMSPQKRACLARDVLRSFCENWIELFCVAGRCKQKVLDSITLSGRHYLDEALSKGRGVIAVSAHYGNYPLIGTKLAREGYPIVMVVRDLEQWAHSAVYRKARAYIDLPSMPTTPERWFYKQAVMKLRSNGILCMISDENKRYGGIFVDFFGRPASTAPGPAGLALRTGAALLPVFIRRNHDGTQTICIEPEITLPGTAVTEAATRELTARFTSVIEGYIRQDPSQWIWTNWRWRTQPEGKAAEAKIRKKTSFKRLRRKVRRYLRRRLRKQTR